MTLEFSIVIPSLNEATSLNELLPELRDRFRDVEIIVVDDGSMDSTEELCRKNSVECVRHPYSKGNGAAVKSGARAATRKYIIFMDADGQHRPEDIDRLLKKTESGFDMVVGSRPPHQHAGIARRLANGVYNKLASWMVGVNIPDLTSGFRLVNRRKFLEFLHLLPNGFSYPTTITMAFFRAGYSVGYELVTVKPRTGRSHIKPLQDGARFLLIIFKVGTLFSPLKIFLPASLLFFLLGTCYYMYTFVMFHSFTNMSAVLLSTSVLVFLMGLISEQITTLLYVRTDRDR